MIIKMDYYKKYLKYKILFTKNPTNQKYFKKYKYYKYKVKYFQKYIIINIDLTDDIQYIFLELEKKNRRFLQTIYNKIPEVKKYFSYDSIVSKLKSEKFLIYLDKILVNLFETKNKFIRGDVIVEKDIKNLLNTSLDFASYFVSSFLSIFFPSSLISNVISKYSEPILSSINLYGDLFLDEIIENNDIIIKKYTSEKRQIIDNKKYKYRETILLCINELVDYNKKIILESMLNGSKISLPQNYEKIISEKLNNLILSIGLSSNIKEKILTVIKNEINTVIETINKKNKKENDLREKIMQDIKRNKEISEKQEKEKKDSMNKMHLDIMSKRVKNNMFDFPVNNMNGFQGNNMNGFQGNNMNGFQGNNMNGFQGNDMDKFKDMFKKMR
jgi:hypothetical protein